jgi:hypothetical protein
MQPQCGRQGQGQRLRRLKPRLGRARAAAWLPGLGGLFGAGAAAVQEQVQVIEDIDEAQLHEAVRSRGTETLVVVFSVGG